MEVLLSMRLSIEGNVHVNPTAISTVLEISKGYVLILS